jgi:hypothetical protein
MDKKRLALKVASYATPYPVVSRVVKSLMKSGKAVAESIPKAKDDEVKAAGATKWAQMTPEQRFQHAYAEGGWSEEDLIKQYGAFRAAKFVLLVIGLALLPALLGVAFTAPLWIVMFTVPVMASFSVVLLAQSLRHAWWQCQIELRAMITFKEFFGRRDLLGWLFA